MNLYLSIKTEYKSNTTLFILSIPYIKKLKNIINVNKMTSKDKLKTLVQEIQARTRHTIEQISENAGYSATTLSQYFRRETGHEKIMKAIEHAYRNKINIIEEPEIYHAAEQTSQVNYLIKINDLLQEKANSLEAQAEMRAQLEMLKQHVIFLQSSLTLSLEKLENGKKGLSEQVKALTIIQDELPGLNARDIPNRINKIIADLMDPVQVG